MQWVCGSGPTHIRGLSPVPSARWSSLAGGAAVIQAVSGRHKYQVKPPDSYFTADDGRTWFAGSSTSYPPFDHDGHTAVRAYVFQCGGKQFVGYMERYSSKAKASLDAGGQLSPWMARFGRELKRPGDPGWTPVKDEATESRIANIKCPDGGSGVPDEIEP